MLRLSSLVMAVTLAACTTPENPLELAQAAEAQLVSGNLPEAAQLYASGVAEHPTSVELATGAAYLRLLQGDPAGADQILAAVEQHAAERGGEVKLRRALVALQRGDLDGVSSLGQASGIALGKLLAAEVALADGERDQAIELLEQVKGQEGRLGRTAMAYLDLLQNEDPLVAGLSEHQALWALGKRKIAVKSVEELARAAGDDEQLLIWAGRAASVGNHEVAESLLMAMAVPPKGQIWRKWATEAIILCASGEIEACTTRFGELVERRDIPMDGLAEASVTAAQLIVDEHPEAARALAGRYLTDGAASVLSRAGAKKKAWEASRSDLFAQHLDWKRENGGGQ